MSKFKEKKYGRVPQSERNRLDKFYPSSGKKIQKRRPAVVVSRKEFNRVTGFCVCGPITSTTRKFPSEVKIENKEVHGYLLTEQLRSFDFISGDIQCTKKLVSEEEWNEIYTKTQLIF